MNTELLDACLIEVCSKIYITLGKGHRERTYQNALEYELRKRYNVIKEYPLTIMYDGIIVNGYFIDLVLNGNMPLELKASKQLGESEEYQIRNYMIQINSNIGYLINFGLKKLQIIKFNNGKKIDLLK